MVNNRLGFSGIAIDPIILNYADVSLPQSDRLEVPNNMLCLLSTEGVQVKEKETTVSEIKFFSPD